MYIYHICMAALGISFASAACTPENKDALVITTVAPEQRPAQSVGVLTRYRSDVDGVYYTRYDKTEHFHAWPLSQVMAAVLNQRMMGQDSMLFRPIDQALETHYLRADGGYAAGIYDGPSAEKYYDDNAWLGLCFMQEYAISGDRRYLQKAERVMHYLEGAQAPQGGIYWKEGEKDKTVNTCSTAPTIQLAMLLYKATGSRPYLDFALRHLEFLNTTLRNEQGMYMDHQRADGSFGRDLWSYNQGTPIGANLWAFQLTGEERFLQMAKSTAQASLRHYGEQDRFWGQPPSFNAIFLRNLLKMRTYLPEVDDFARQYADRLWRQARRADLGTFELGSIGAYDNLPGNVLDLGGILQALQLPLMTPQQLEKAY